MYILCLTHRFYFEILPVPQVDPVFEGLDGGAGSLIKYNPLSNLSSAETWNFLRVMVGAVGWRGAGCQTSASGP